MFQSPEISGQTFARFFVGGLFYWINCLVGLDLDRLLGITVLFIGSLGDPAMQLVQYKTIPTDSCPSYFLDHKIQHHFNSTGKTVYVRCGPQKCFKEYLSSAFKTLLLVYCTECKSLFAVQDTRNWTQMVCCLVIAGGRPGLTGLSPPTPRD